VFGTEAGARAGGPHRFATRLRERPVAGSGDVVGDDLALVAMGALAGGLLVETVGAVMSVSVVGPVGRAMALFGAFAYAYLVLGVFVQRARE